MILVLKAWAYLCVVGAALTVPVFGASVFMLIWTYRGNRKGWNVDWLKRARLGLLVGFFVFLIFHFGYEFGHQAAMRQMYKELPELVRREYAKREICRAYPLLQGCEVTAKPISDDCFVWGGGEIGTKPPHPIAVVECGGRKP